MNKGMQLIVDKKKLLVGRPIYKNFVQFHMEVKNMKLAEKLQLMRKREGLSQEDLAEKLGISRQAVSKW